MTPVTRSVELYLIHGKNLQKCKYISYYILLVEQIMSVKEQISVHGVTEKIEDKILAPMCICNVII